MNVNTYRPTNTVSSIRLLFSWALFLGNETKNDSLKYDKINEKIIARIKEMMRLIRENGDE